MSTSLLFTSKKNKILSENKLYQRLNSSQLHLKSKINVENQIPTETINLKRNINKKKYSSKKNHIDSTNQISNTSSLSINPLSKEYSLMEEYKQPQKNVIHIDKSCKKSVIELLADCIKKSIHNHYSFCPGVRPNCFDYYENLDIPGPGHYNIGTQRSSRYNSSKLFKRNNSCNKISFLSRSNSSQKYMKLSENVHLKKVNKSNFTVNKNNQKKLEFSAEEKSKDPLNCSSRKKEQINNSGSKKILNAEPTITTHIAPLNQEILNLNQKNEELIDLQIETPKRQKYKFLKDVKSPTKIEMNKHRFIQKSENKSLISLGISLKSGEKIAPVLTIKRLDKQIQKKCQKYNRSNLDKFHPLNIALKSLKSKFNSIKLFHSRKLS